MSKPNKNAQLMPSTIKGKQPANQEEGPGVWDAFKAFVAGLPQGFANTGLTTRQQYEWAKQRKRRGMPPYRPNKNRRLSIPIPFTRVSSSWFSDLCQSKEF